MGTRVSYPLEVKQKAVEMRLAGVPMKEIMQELNIKNNTQIKTWVRWYKAGDTHRLNSLLVSNTLMEKVRSILPN